MYESEHPVGGTDELDEISDDVVDDAADGEPTDDVESSPEPAVDPAVAAAEAELDALNDSFDTVDAALKALDRDDLDEAEQLAASLGDTSAVDTNGAEPESSSEA